ncbi:recombinase family protein [Nocardia amamiensis]|uniref:recombinase family protein n=1 Tax=Nocardia amamiensis TaxID=404578 RepID=UPI001E317E0B|nr:recombinase family protein [Nocardia amamiensis]
MRTGVTNDAVAERMRSILAAQQPVIARVSDDPRDGHPRCAAPRRGTGLKVLEQGIDTGTAEGRVMFGMLSVRAEFQRELM